jgi:hypothetical protein
VLICSALERFDFIQLHPSGAVGCSPVRPFGWVNKQAKNRRFLTEKKFTNNKKWQILGMRTLPGKKNNHVFLPCDEKCYCAERKTRIPKAPIYSFF